MSEEVLDRKKKIAYIHLSRLGLVQTCYNRRLNMVKF